MAFQIQEGSLQRTCEINEENLDLASPNLPKQPQSYSDNEICKFAKCRCIRHIINNLPMEKEEYFTRGQGSKIALVRLYL